MTQKKQKNTGMVFGTRSEVAKVVSVVGELKKFEPQITIHDISTGQYREMLQQVLDLFPISPDVDQELMAQGQLIEYIVTETLTKIPQCIKSLGLDALAVQGDTATAFIAGQASFYCKVPVAYIEAGLRTYDKFQPFTEEVYRRLLGHFTGWHFTPILLPQPGRKNSFNATLSREFR